MQELADKHVDIAPNFGVHPWCVLELYCSGMRVLVCVSNAREFLTGGWLAALTTG